MNAFLLIAIILAPQEIESILTAYIHKILVWSMYRPWVAKQNPYNFCLVYQICQVWIWIHSIHTSVTELNTCHNYEHIMCGPKTKWHVQYRGVGGVLSINTCIVWSLYSPSYYKTSRKDWQEGIWLCHLPFWWESSTDLYMFGIPNAAQQAISLAGINSHVCGLLAMHVVF